MINQKQITAKIDYGVYGALETESFVTGINRNRLINEAIRFMIRYKDARRADLAAGTDHKKTACELLRWEERWNLR